MSTTPYAFVKRGNLFIIPVGPSIDEVQYPTQTMDRSPDYSVWVNGSVRAPGPDLDDARMSPGLYREVRADLVRYSPVEVTRSAIRRSEHAYVGVIDSRGKPYYFALDSRGVSVRPADGEAAWKAFDRLAEEEHMRAVRQRRGEAAADFAAIASGNDQLVVTKGIKYGKKVDWKHDIPGSKWWRKVPRARKKRGSQDEAPPPEAQKAIGSDVDLVVEKALPRGQKKNDEVKRAKPGKASKKQAGAGGRTRYTYPREGKNGGKGKNAGKQPVPLVVVHDDTRHADPGELANQLGVSVRTLRRAARRLGSDEFSKFMRSRLGLFAAKHRLDPDYWGTLYAHLVSGVGELVNKGDDSDREFGEHVRATASAVPREHHERFGERKVFIHHVHHEMKRRGLYSGSLDSFKERVVHAHQKGHLVAARADLVAAMDPRSVSQSETNADGSTYHFIDNAKHDPGAADKLRASSAGSGPDAAHQASEKAREASTHAGKVGTTEAHLAAMTAHHHAGVAHQKASGKVSDKTALRHFKQSTTHLKASKAGG